MISSNPGASASVGNKHDKCPDAVQGVSVRQCSHAGMPARYTSTCLSHHITWRYYLCCDCILST
jgi:hypothetical protein